MSKLLEVANPPEGCREFSFHCPGCGTAHLLRVKKEGGDPDGPTWAWNGSLSEPTASPSVLVRRPPDQRCHFYLREGKLQFLSDCTHELAGETVELPDVEAE